MTRQENERREAIVRAMVVQNRKTIGMPTTRTVAKYLGMKAPMLYKLLRQHGVLTKDEYGYWFCDEYADLGLARMRIFIYIDSDGAQCLKQYPVWTEKGIDFIKRQLRMENGKLRCN